MYQQYRSFDFRNDTLVLISRIDTIVNEYASQGYKLSVRQIYYQLVARAIVENTERSYKRVAGIINDGRLAGMIDWDVIEDRGRDITVRNRWDSGSAILEAVAKQFHMDMWANQPGRVFVIVEKAALEGVLGRVCTQYDVPLLAARGYPSVSVVRELVLDHFSDLDGQFIKILHLGDHDPSGIDMTRDLIERITLFIEDAGCDWDLERIALNRDQINAYNPPPNPAKTTDARFAGYRRQHGNESWELDALDPTIMSTLVESHITRYLEEEKWQQRLAEIQTVKDALKETAQQFQQRRL